MFGEAKKPNWRLSSKKSSSALAPNGPYQMTQTSRNLPHLPNLIINDIMAITVRTFFPVAPDYIEINRLGPWPPKDESPDNRALRLDNFLTFLGPGGFCHPR